MTYIKVSISTKHGGFSPVLLNSQDFRTWQIQFLSNPKMYRVRKWGDPIMVRQGFDVAQAGTSNFQAVKLYNKATDQMGGISNYLWIPRTDIDRISAMQVEDEYQDKNDDWLNQKMRWLCKRDGTIYFGVSGDWDEIPRTKWGTISLGGNLVQVDGFETLRVKTPDGVIAHRSMARLAGFRRTDWNRPISELISEGLVHRCFCAYSGNGFGDTPKGIAYSPFFSPLDWIFIGESQVQPEHFYLPADWLEKLQKVG